MSLGLAVLTALHPPFSSDGRECRLWDETAFAQNLPLLPASCVTLERSPLSWACCQVHNIEALLVPTL